MRCRRAEQSCARVLIARCAANAIDDLGAIAGAVLAAPSDVPVWAAEPSVVVLLHGRVSGLRIAL